MAVPPTVLSTAPASLYVGDLHPDVTDGQLFDAFSEFKSLASVRICRDSSTGRSLCYGYVNFISPQDAIEAIETKNNTALNGKLMRVMWSDRDPDSRKSGKGNVFVKNLSESVDNVGLQALFGKYGTIISCKVATFEDGKSKGHGFVQFDSEDSANSSIENLNGSLVHDKHIYVGKFLKKSDRALPSPDAKYTNLYVKNLDPDITEELLKEKFSEFGKVVSLMIERDQNGTSREFGFVNFVNPDDAKQAMETMNGIELGSKVLYVGRAQKKAEREQVLHHMFEEKRKEQIMKFKGSNVYVKNIDDDVTDEELRELFCQCGMITSAKLMVDGKGRSKGFGFVCFSNPEEASKAVNRFHGLMFHRKPLYVAIAQRKEDRQAQLQLQYAHKMVGLAGPSTALIPGGYHPPLYCTAPSSVVSQVPPGPGLMYQPLGIRPGWRGDGFEPLARPTLQPAPVPVMPNSQRQQKQTRGRDNGNVFPQGGALSVSHMQPSAQPLNSSKESTNQRAGQAKYEPNGRTLQVDKGSAVSSTGTDSLGSVSQGYGIHLQRAGQAKYEPNGRTLEVDKGSAVSFTGTNSLGSVSQGSEVLSSMLAAATADEQKRILGEQLYPLIQKHKPDLVAKITGMLLEMDNSELLLLLESPESLAAKVDEAVQVLKISKTKVSGQESVHSNYLSAGVAVN